MSHLCSELRVRCEGVSGDTQQASVTGRDREAGRRGESRRGGPDGGIRGVSPAASRRVVGRGRRLLQPWSRWLLSASFPPEDSSWEVLGLMGCRAPSTTGETQRPRKDQSLRTWSCSHLT